jgi:hypothetical protein
MTTIRYGLTMQTHSESSSLHHTNQSSLGRTDSIAQVGYICFLPFFFFCSQLPRTQSTRALSNSFHIRSIMPVHSIIKPIQTVCEGRIINAHAPRDPGLPQLYEVFDHPLRPNRRSIVYLADMTVKGRLEALKVESRQRLPGPGFDHAQNSGK